MDCERILREADIIKNIKHTGIPLVYDIEEDSDSICIIEEYIAGNSLAEYISKGRLSVTQMAIISVKICEVLEYLHNCRDIIHMDLKPGNIIIHENDSADGKGSGTSSDRGFDINSNMLNNNFNITSGKALTLSSYDVSIIDFDSSVSVGETASAYGSAGFAAPEQYEAAVWKVKQETDCHLQEAGRISQEADCHLQEAGRLTKEAGCHLQGTDCGPQNTAEGISTRTDCYSVGMLLLYMACEGRMQSMAEEAEQVLTLYSDTIGPVIRKCIRHNQSQRFNSIEELKKELIKVLNQENNKNVNTGNAYDIYVYGIKRCVGTTHLSLCLAAFLKKFFVGKKVLYIRHGDREDIFLEAVKGRLTKTGAYESHGIYIMPDYGDCIRCDLSEFDVIVHDCGTANFSAYISADISADNMNGGTYAELSGNADVQGSGRQKQAASGTGKTVSIIYVGDCGYRKSDIAFMNNISDIGGEISVFINHISGKAFYNFIRDNRRGGKPKIMKKDKKNPVKYYRMPCMYEWYESNKLFEEAVIEALGLEKTKR